MKKVVKIVSLVFFTVVCGCRGEVPDALRSKVQINDTQSFVSACLREKNRCMAVHFFPKGKSSYREEITYIGSSLIEILPMTEFGWTSGEIRLGTRCEGETLAVSYLKDSHQTWGSVKSHPIAKDYIKGKELCYSIYDIPKNIRGLKLSFSYSDTTEGMYVNETKLHFAHQYAFEVSGAGMEKTYVQSSAFKEGIFSGELAPVFSTVTPTDPNNAFIAVSTYSSLGEVASRYDEIAQDMVRKNNRVFGNVHDFNGLLREYNRLSLKYKMDDSNRGAFPVRSISEIIESGYVECKEAALVGLAIAKQSKIPAQIVLTGTQRPVPLFLFAPDWSWMDHVVLYFPSEGKFIDLTADIDRQVVAIDRSTLYAHMGVLVPSGDVVVLK